MKKIYFITFIAAISLNLQAQTLISSHFPSPGDVYKYFYTDTLGILPGASGTAQIWNFEDLNVDTILQTDNYLAPIVTNPAVTGHTTALGDSLNGYTFYKNTATEYTMMGLSDSGNVTVVPYSNPMILLLTCPPSPISKKMALKINMLYSFFVNLTALKGQKCFILES